MINTNSSNQNLKTLLSGKNPQEVASQLLMNNTNPIFVNLIKMAQNGDTKGVEKFARNVFKERGRNYDEEFNNFLNQFGLKK